MFKPQFLVSKFLNQITKVVILTLRRFLILSPLQNNNFFKK